MHLKFLSQTFSCGSFCLRTHVLIIHAVVVSKFNWNLLIKDWRNTYLRPFFVLSLISAASVLHSGTAFFLVYLFFNLYYQRAFCYLFSYSLQDTTQLLCSWQFRLYDFLDVSSLWTLPLASTYGLCLFSVPLFLTPLFTQVRLGISSYNVPLVAGCSFVKATCSIYCPLSKLQNRHNLREIKCHFYWRFTILYYVSAILKFLCLPCFSLI